MFLTMVFKSGVEFAGLLIVFVLIIAASYYTTKWIGKHSLVNSQVRNVKMIESYRIAPNQYVEIIQIGSRYFAIGVSKEHIEMLAEINSEDLLLEDGKSKQQFQFQDVLAFVKKKQSGEGANKDKR